MDGRVIGINQSVAGGAQGIGFAIPVDAVRTDVAAMQSGSTPRDTAANPPRTAFIGLQLVALGAIRSQMKYDGQNGVGVQAVTAGGPADTSGVAQSVASRSG
jgi:S1-C subfamily serine protease